MGDHLAISGGLLQAPLNPLKTCIAGAARSFRWARPPRGPTVIRPLTLPFNVFIGFSAYHSISSSRMKLALLKTTQRNLTNLKLESRTDLH